MEKEGDSLISSTEISNLNDDCLMHVFQQLDVMDRLRLEIVCKRWQAVLKESWNDVKTLRFYHDGRLGLKKEGDLGKFSMLKLEKILNYCGRHVKCLEVYEVNCDLDNVLGIVARRCPNIKYIRVNVSLNPSSIRLLAENCTEIIELSLGAYTGHVCDEELALLFSRNDKLRSLHLFDNNDVTGECLAMLNADSIENINFFKCNKLSIERFRILRSFNNLKTLGVYGFTDTSIEAAEDISECFRTLKTLSIFRGFHDSIGPSFPFSSRMIEKLRNVETLIIPNNNTITDDLLVAVGNFCKFLKDVDISCCSLVTNRGLAAVLALPNLENLRMMYLNNVDDSVFNRVPKLLELHCGYCPNIGDYGISRLIEYSHNLNLMDIVGCKNITNRSIEAAIKYTKRRDNGVVLTIIGCCTTGIEYSDEIDEDSSPLLQLI